MSLFIQAFMISLLLQIKCTDSKIKDLKKDIPKKFINTITIDLQLRWKTMSALFLDGQLAQWSSCHSGCTVMTNKAGWQVAGDLLPQEALHNS